MREFWGGFRKYGGKFTIDRSKWRKLPAMRKLTLKQLLLWKRLFENVWLANLTPISIWVARSEQHLGYSHKMATREIKWLCSSQLAIWKADVGWLSHVFLLRLWLNFVKNSEISCFVNNENSVRFTHPSACPQQSMRNTNWLLSQKIPFRAAPNQ